MMGMFLSNRKIVFTYLSLSNIMNLMTTVFVNDTFHQLKFMPFGKKIKLYLW